MNIEHLQPEGLFPAQGMSHVVIASGRTAYIAGQGAFDEHFRLVGDGDLFVQAMHQALDGAPFPPNASTLVGVSQLAYPEMMIEISAIAALDTL